jgi:hypothetical protein
VRNDFRQVTFLNLESRKKKTMAIVPLLVSPNALACLLLLSTLHQTAKTAALILYDDGSVHSITESINDSINLRSSSSLIFDDDSRHVIRAPKGSESAVRLYMSSLLNMTSGEIIGGELEDVGDHSNGDDNLSGAGVIVGSASRAEFNNGATVRGGSHASDIVTSDSQVQIAESATNLQSGKGGDALIGLYFGSSIIIKGGIFIGGRGISINGHSLHVAYDAQAQVYGGSFEGSFLARDRGAIVVHGCLSRVGNRLVGHFENGDEVDLQLVEENGGQVVVEAPKHFEACSKYNKRSSDGVRGETFRVLTMVGVMGGLLLSCF